MNEPRCNHPAIALFPWGGKIIPVCDVHLKAMSALNFAIGGVQQSRGIEPGSQDCEMPDDREMYQQPEKEV